MKADERLVALRRRPRTLSVRALKRSGEGDMRARLLALVDEHRPRSRAECRDAPRPCLFVSCRFHLYLDVAPNGSLKLNFPHLEIWQLPETCALDVAERGGLTLDEVGELLNVTRERARQLLSGALWKVKGQL